MTAVEKRERKEDISRKRLWAVTNAAKYGKEVVAEIDSGRFCENSLQMDKGIQRWRKRGVDGEEQKTAQNTQKR